MDRIWRGGVMGICSDNISRTCKAIAFWVLHCHGTEDINYLELQSTAGELSRECHRVTALRTTWLRYKSRAGTCNATPGIFASKVCLPSGTPVADSADLDCKRSEGCRRSGSAQDEPSLEAGGKQPWYWRPFKSSRNCTMSCMEMRRGL